MTSPDPPMTQSGPVPPVHAPSCMGFDATDGPCAVTGWAEHRAAARTQHPGQPDRLAEAQEHFAAAERWLNVEHPDPGTVAIAQVHATLAVAARLGSGQPDPIESLDVISYIRERIRRDSQAPDGRAWPGEIDDILDDAETIHRARLGSGQPVLSGLDEEPVESATLTTEMPAWTWFDPATGLRVYSVQHPARLAATVPVAEPPEALCASVEPHDAHTVAHPWRGISQPFRCPGRAVPVAEEGLHDHHRGFDDEPEPDRWSEADIPVATHEPWEDR